MGAVDMSAVDVLVIGFVALMLALFFVGHHLAYSRQLERAVVHLMARRQLSAGERRLAARLLDESGMGGIGGMGLPAPATRPLYDPRDPRDPRDRQGAYAEYEVHEPSQRLRGPMSVPLAPPPLPPRAHAHTPRPAWLQEQVEQAERSERHTPRLNGSEWEE